jgi:uncharacterized membrane protein
VTPGVLFPGVALLLVSLGWPLARRRVKPNRWYGLRVPATFADERVWYAANAAAGRDMMLVGSAVGVAGLLLPMMGIQENLVAVACAALLTVGSLGATLRAWRLANRLYRDRPADGPAHSGGPR